MIIVRIILLICMGLPTLYLVITKDKVFLPAIRNKYMAVMSAIGVVLYAAECIYDPNWLGLLLFIVYSVILYYNVRRER